MVSYRQNRVSKTTWPWPDGMAPSNEAPPRPWRRAVIQAAVMGAVALFFYWKIEKRVAAWVVAGLAGFVLFSGLFVPRVFLGIDRVMRAFGRIVGIALTWVLLVPFFFLCFVPARLILWLRRSDPMNRAFPSGEATYWVPHRSHRDMSRYGKQF